MKRRDWLKGTLAAAFAGATTGLAGCASALPPAHGLVVAGRNPVMRRPRNIIFLAYDGTGYEDLAAAGHFSRRIVGRPLLMEQFLAEGATGSMATPSLTAIVTDSSAASSAWSTGRKIVNAAVSIYPDGTPLTTILELAQGRGMRTGLVTSTRITHATPAAWIAKAASRDEEQEIARQYLDSGVDVLLGGGQGPFDPASREDGRDLHAEFAERGYEVLRSAEDLERSTGSKLFGTFTPAMQHLPYEIDRRYQAHPAPSLAQITSRALEVLSGADRGFILQVEAGRIDHANHNSDPGGMIWDWMAADETLRLIKEFADRDGETLVIFAPDHDTGGSVVYGYGAWYQGSNPAFDTLGQRRASHEWFTRQLGRQPTSAEVIEAARDLLAVPLTPEYADAIVTALTTRPLTPELRRGHLNAFTSQPNNTLGQILSTSPDRSPDRPNIAFATGAHTAGLVPVALYGGMVQPGNLGVVDNTELFGVMTGALGIDFENPVMTEEEARQYARAPRPSYDGMHA